MTVRSDALRDKRPTFLRIFTTEYNHFRSIPKGTRAYAMAVYMCLASHANSHTDTVFPSHSVICDHTGLSKNTVLKALDALIESGHVMVAPRFTKGERTSNVYTLLPVVVHDVNPQDVVVHDVNDLVNQANDLVNVANHPVHDANSNYTHEPDQATKPKKERGSGPLSLARHSPTGDAPSPAFPELKLATPERWNELRDEMRGKIKGRA